MLEIRSEIAKTSSVQSNATTLDRLMEALDVRVSAFALIKISPGHRLAFSGSYGPVVHFVLTGSGFFAFPDVSGLPVEAGDIVIIPSSVQKTLQAGGAPVVDVRLGDHCKTSLAGLFEIDAGPGPPVLSVLCGSIALGNTGSYGFFGNLTDPLREDLRAIPFAKAAFVQLREEFAAPAVATHAIAGALMKACLALVLRKHLDKFLALDGLEVDISRGNLRSVMMLVLDRPGTPHTLNSLSTVAGMSRTSFARAFKAAFATSPMAFVMKVRLHHAATLLATTDLPIKMVASNAGLSRSYFSRAFHAAYGLDPLSFRDRAPTLNCKDL